MTRPIALALAGLLLAACLGPEASPEPDAAQLLRAAAENSQAPQSFHFKLAFDGASTPEGPPVKSAEGDVHRPSDVRAVGLLRSDNLLVEVDYVAVGGRIFVKGATGGWQEVPAALAGGLFNPSAMFAPETGLFALLPRGAGARVTGKPGRGSDASYVIGARFDTEVLRPFLSSVRRGQPLQAILWIGAQDHRLRRAVMTGRMYDAGKDTSATIELSAFDQPVRIERPS